MKRFELILLVITIGLAFFLGYCNSRVIEIPYDVVSTDGGFVDSVEVDGIVKENTITKTITNTVTNTIEKNSLYVDLGINYSPEYSLFPQAGLVYTRKGFGYGLGGGYIFDKDEQDSWFIGGKLLIRLR